MSDTASSIADDFDSDDSESTGVWSSPVKHTYNRSGGNVCGGSRLLPKSGPPGHRFNVIQKLHMRALYGKVKEKSRGREMKIFSRLPGRLAFFLRDVVPHSALCAGHIFLGFSDCGQFLLSYTQTTIDSVFWGQISINYYYRLHWWVFVPYSKARKVAEVTLFSNQGVFGNLQISVCQWPSDPRRLVVYGQETPHDPDIDEVLSGSLHCYLTVTNAPSLDNCADCVKVASSYDADDVAAAWNSCVRLSCLKHGATVHTQFDLVPPYPKFEPKISLKREGCVVINTGNFLHSFTVDLEALGSQEQHNEDKLVTSSVPEHPFRGINPLSPPFNAISVNVGMAEFALGTGSPGGFSPASFPHNSDSENTDVESESSYPTRSQKKMKGKRPLNFLETGSKFESPAVRERNEKIQEFSEKLVTGGRNYARDESRKGRDEEGCSSLVTEKDDPNVDNAVSSEVSKSENRRQNDRKATPVKTCDNADLVSDDDCQERGAKGSDGARLSSDPSPSTSMGTRRRTNQAEGFQFTVPPTPGTSDKKRKLADAAYDLTDENFTTDLPEKLSTYRRKRLAEKKYEFTEEEEDQKLFPITRLRSKKLNENSSVLSRVLQSSTQDLMVCVSERKSEPESAEDVKEDGSVEEDCWADMLDGASYPELFSPGGCIKKDANSMSPRLCQAMSPKMMTTAISPRASNPEFYCRAKFIRRYIEVDDELISVITDVEDDDLGATTGFHSALPLEVHGSGYTQMQMISNSKAEKLQLDCVRVEQRSLDLEQFCHETATRLCAAADKKFWFINDYDVEVVDVDPGNGDVVVVAVVLIQAAILTKSQSQKFNVSSLSRKQYQANFKFCWNIDTGQYHVVDSDPLKEIHGFKEQGVHWNPARMVSAPLAKAFRCQDPSIKCLTNESVIRGVSLKAIVDPDNLVALIMNDLE